MPSATHTLYYCLGGIFSILFLATIAILLLQKCRPQQDWVELQQRMNSWWIIVILFSLAMVSPKWLALTFFGLLSFLSLKEYTGLALIRPSPNSPLLWMNAAIPLQYLLIGMSWYGMFLIFIPVYLFLILPARMVAIGNTRGFLHSVSVMHWGMMMTVFALSHVAFLLVLPKEGAREGSLLVIFLVALTELNDIAQYLWGKSLGKIKVTPTVSPNKTLAGLLGGIGTTMLLATILGPVLTQMNWLYSLGAGMIIGVGGFCGDVVMSAIKRDAGVKDTGNLLPGHGGILDRLDSLMYTAPLFFHFYYYLYY
ncbi:phosphatidate cytidylyltransferase [Lonsdalea britannica]|uniref:Phosphatidate cytidylyltransferase n=1 Tax=Lonsdalea britannica TaxID=1082704 RepID=A0AAD0SJ87_9GAMM|nr:phosphatidate cytidylyltransferase [Lonsdalea britannica]AXW88621.1 phosphatidate cytidylyltransferase [Lonsdalea britannica]OSM94631.1 phosphatidate cytidylyltransferase [Lonsdalea britannica]